MATGGAAGRAIDGNTDSIWGMSSCTHTRLETDPWWRGDLGSSQHVSEVFLVNRVEIQARLVNIEIRVGKQKILYDFMFIEQFSIECRKTKTKAITMANHNKRKQHNEPMRTQSKYT